MCYYSKTLRPDQFRAAKEGEDLTLTADGVGHHFATSEADGKIVCILPGTQLHIENFQLNQQWKRNLPHSTWRLLEELDIPYLNFHSATRHTFVTLLRRERVDAEIVQSVVRHARISTTMDVYSHLDVDDQQPAAAAIQRLLGD